MIHPDPNAPLEASLKRHLEEGVGFLYCNSIFEDELPGWSAIADDLVALGIPNTIHPPRLVEIAVDKSKTRSFCSRQGLNMATGLEASCAEDVAHLFTGTRGPIVCKRTRESAGHGMVVINSIEDISNLDFRTVGYVAETFVDGVELSANVFAARGRFLMLPLVLKGRTDRGGKHPTLRIRICPTPQDVALGAVVEEFARSFADTLQPNGWLEFDFVLANGALVLLEVNPRVSGSLEMAGACAGVNPHELAVSAVMGCAVEPPKARYWVAEIPVRERPAYRSELGGGCKLIRVNDPSRGFGRLQLIGRTHRELLRNFAQMADAGAAEVSLDTLRAAVHESAAATSPTPLCIAKVRSLGEAVVTHGSAGCS